jgi:hypothetical protein
VDHHLPDIASGLPIDSRRCAIAGSTDHLERRSRMRAIDLTGRRFGRLTAIRRVPTPYNSVKTTWLCLCDCGTEKCCRTTDLLHHRLRSCGCLSRPNLIGQQFGALTVTAEAPRRNTRRHWYCRCQCGREIIAETSHLRTGRKTSCGCQTVRRIKNRRVPPGQSLWNYLYASYRRNARMKNIQFSLDLPRLMHLCRQPCYYCGAPPHRLLRRKGCPDELFVNGIDRLNNRLGYIHRNVVPCCYTCNYRKSDSHVHDFLRWIARVAHHRKLVSASPRPAARASANVVPLPGLEDDRQWGTAG